MGELRILIHCSSWIILPSYYKAWQSTQCNPFFSVKSWNISVLLSALNPMLKGNKVTQLLCLHECSLVQWKPHFEAKHMTFWWTTFNTQMCCCRSSQKEDHEALQCDAEQIQVLIHSKIINAHVQVDPTYMGR